MREQQVFAKLGSAEGDFDIDRDAGQVPVARERVGREGERHQRRLWRDDG